MPRMFSATRERERVSWYVWSAKPHARTSRSTKALTNWRAIARQSTRAPGQTRGSWYFWCVKPMLSKKEKVFQFDFWRVSRDYWIESLGKAVRLQRKLQRHRKHVETCCERASFVAGLIGIMFPIASWAPAFFIPDLPVSEEHKRTNWFP